MCSVCSEPFPVRRGVIQGDIFSPQCCTLGLDRMIRLHDIAGQGIGGPSLGDVTASKLEYTDDVGLLDWTAAEASERVSALASGSRASASMEMSALKSKGMHVRVRGRLSVSTEVEVEALDLPHSCPECERSFPTTSGLAVHRARWCRPGQRPASRRGQLADKAVKLAKRKASVALLPPVVMEGESLETVYQFNYPGCHFTSDGDDAADMRHRMAIAGERSRGLNHLWSDNRLQRSLKMRLYAASFLLDVDARQRGVDPDSQSAGNAERFQLPPTAPHHREVISRGGHQALVRPADGCTDAETSLAGPYSADACRPPSAPCGVGNGPTSWPAISTWQPPDRHAPPPKRTNSASRRGWPRYDRSLSYLQESP